MGWISSIVSDLGGAVEAHAHPIVADLGGVTHTSPQSDEDTRAGSTEAPSSTLYQTAKKWAQDLTTMAPELARAASFPEKVGAEKISPYVNAPLDEALPRLLAAGGVIPPLSQIPQPVKDKANEIKQWLGATAPAHLQAATMKKLGTYLDGMGYHGAASLARAYAGAGEGEADFARAMSSPSNLAMMYGGGVLAGAGRGGAIANRLIAGGFSAQMLWDAYKNAPGVAEAMKSGDIEMATRALTGYFGTAIMAGMGLSETVAPHHPIAPTDSVADISAEGSHAKRQIVAQRKGKVVGGMGYELDPEGNARVHSHSVIVSPDQRGQGIGTDMLEHTVRDAKVAGGKRITTDGTALPEEIKGLWRKLATRGYPIHEITHENGATGYSLDLEPLQLKTAAPPQITFSEDQHGRFATATDLPQVRVYVPDHLQGEDATKYANEKLDLQRQFLASRAAKPAPRNDGVPEIAQAANEYNSTQNRPPVVASNQPIDAEFGKRTADAYEAMEHNPSDPRVQRSYAAFKQDVKNQWDYATKVLGITFEPTIEDPYKGGTLTPSQEMEADVRNNRHLYFYSTETLPTDHPNAEVDPETGLTYNQMFRAVHDLFGHAAHGNQFGPTGERNAYLDHAQMFSHEAIPALTNETHGQKSWVNFGKHLRDAEGNIPKKGEPGHIPPKDRPFAEQKAGWMPKRLQAHPTYHPDLQAMADKYGVTDRADKALDSRAVFVAPDGRFVLAGGYHPDAIDAVAGDKYGKGENRPQFIEDTGAVRVRAGVDRGGKTLHISVPSEGVTPEQVEALRRLTAQQGRYGNVALERADITPETANLLSRYKEFSRPNDIEDMLHEIAAHPETKDTANLMLKTAQREGEPLLHIPQEMIGVLGDTASTVGHEYGHVLETALRNAGTPTDGIFSHNHERMIQAGGAAGIESAVPEKVQDDIALYGYREGLRKTGVNGLPHYRNWLDRILAGGVTEQEYYGIPWAKNGGLASDIANALRLLKAAGITDPHDIANEFVASHDRIKHDLHLPGMRDIFMKYASSREPGLAPEYHASLERLNNFIDEVKNHYETQKGPQTLASRGRIPEARAAAPAGEAVVGERGGVGRLADAGRTAAAARRGGVREERGGEAPEQLSLALKKKVAGDAEKSAAAEPEEEETAPWQNVAERQVSEGQTAGALDPKTGKPDTTGYGLEFMPEHRMVLDHEPTKEDFQNFYEKNKALFDAHPELRVGWDTNRDDGKSEINVAISADNLAAAYLVARRLGQRAIWDIEKGREIQVGGTGEVSPRRLAQYPLDERFADLRTPHEIAPGETVSTRVPSGVKSKESVMSHGLNIDMPTVHGAEGLGEKFVSRIENPNEQAGRDKPYAGIKLDEGASTKQKLRKVVRHMADNLKALYRESTPEEREQNKEWYPGGNRLTKDVAEKNDYSHPQTAGVTAVLSPQKDWDMNVSLMRRLVDIHKNQTDTVTTPKMLEKSKEIQQNMIKTQGEKGAAVAKALRIATNEIEGKTYGELKGKAKAAWLRLYDETYNPRTYEEHNPDGSAKGFAHNLDGSPSNVAWGGLASIEKAISILEDGSRENISNQLGDAHKVRSFYNNLIEPDSPRNDVTSDTHSVGASLFLPLSGDDVEVNDNFERPKHAETGLQGTYPLYAEAMRTAARELDIPHPRALQSIVWTKWRDLIPSEIRTSEFKKEAEGIWKGYEDGKYGADEARKRILAAAERRRNSLAQKGGGRGEQGKLFGAGVSGEPARPVPDRARGAVAAKPAAKRVNPTLKQVLGGKP